MTATSRSLDWVAEVGAVASATTLPSTMTAEKVSAASGAQAATASAEQSEGGGGSYADRPGRSFLRAFSLAHFLRAHALSTPTRPPFPLGSWSEVTLNATAPVNPDVAVRKAVVGAFAEARLATADDPEAAALRFTGTLEQLLNDFGAPALDSTAEMVLLGGADPLSSLCALSAVGQMPKRVADQTRRDFAEQALRSAVPELRIGAVGLLADLEDQDVIPSLVTAVQRERIAALRLDMEHVIAQLHAR
jgi:hypothetical protein